MKDTLTVDQTSGARFELALELLSDGKLVVVKGLHMSFDADGTLACEMQASFNPKQYSEERARADLRFAREVLDEIKGESERIRELLEGRPVRFAIIDDYATGIVTLCREEGARLVWT